MSTESDVDNEPLASDDEWMTVEQIAAAWSRNPETIRRWIRDSHLPATQTPRGHWQVKRSDVVKAFEKGRKVGRPPKNRHEDVSIVVPGERVSLED